jgi:hypothetical protein
MQRLARRFFDGFLSRSPSPTPQYAARHRFGAHSFRACTTMVPNVLDYADYLEIVVYFQLVESQSAMARFWLK